MSEDGDNIDLRPLEPHDRMIGLPEQVIIVLVCEREGEIVGYLYSTVYGWTNNWEVVTPNSTPETWAHWQTHRAALAHLLDMLHEQAVHEADRLLDESPKNLNYTYMLASYMNYVMRRTRRSYLEDGRVPDIFDEVEWKALQVAEKQALSWGLDCDYLSYEPQPSAGSN